MRTWALWIAASTAVVSGAVWAIARSWDRRHRERGGGLTTEKTQAVGELIDRSIRPVVTIMFAGAVCWIAIRSELAITADQFVGIVTAVLLFWFGARGAGGATTPTTTTETRDTKTVTGPPPPPAG